MTPEQKNALVQACDQGDDVKIVTIALQVCAWLARNKRQEDAVVLRNKIDDAARIEHAIREYKKKRLEIATVIYAANTKLPMSDTVKLAGLLMQDNDTAETPFDTDEHK